MLMLRLLHADSPTVVVPLKKSPFTFGRDSASDLCIDDPAISRCHCEFMFKDERWLLIDSSRNGIMHEQTQIRITRKCISVGDRFRLGRRTILEIVENPVVSFEETKILSDQPTQFISLDYEQGEVVTGRAVLTATNPDGLRNECEIQSRTFTIGAHQSNDLVLKDETVSQFHARIDFQDNAYWLRDLESTNGIRINGLKLKGGKSALPLVEESVPLELGNYQLEFQVKRTSQKIKPLSTHQFMGILSRDSKMQKLFSMIEVVASTDAPVLIHGETGTGKELVAHAIHQLSQRESGPFIAINCAALPKDLAESELFGHEKGAFTGAAQQRPGAFELAHRGTLFLDEVGELQADVQAKLLRALEEKEIRRVGGTKPIPLSVRILSATHKDLSRSVKEESFREDLFFRLNVVPIHLPALRDRIDDLDLLVPHFLQSLEPRLQIDERFLEIMKDYAYPGNIRELRGILQRAHIQWKLLGAKGPLNAKHFDFIPKWRGLSLAETEEERQEAQKIERLLEEENFHQMRVAKRLGIAASTLHDRMKRFGLLNLKRKAKL